MKELKTKDGKHTIEIYDGIDEMLETRYHRFNQMLILSSGIGNTIDAVISKLRTVRQLIADGRINNADMELLNMYQSLYFVENGIDPKSTAFAALVKSIDGEPCEDITDSGLENTSKRIREFLTIGERNEAVSSAKKKIESELNQFFPHRNDDNLEQLVLMKSILTAKLDEIIEDADKSAEIEKISRRMRDLTEVVDYRSYEIESEKEREKSYISIQEQMHVDAKRMTVREYETACEMLRERAKEYEKARKKQ